MIAQYHIHTLNTANKALQKAWERVLRARQGKDPIALQNAVMAYCQSTPAGECDGGDGDNSKVKPCNLRLILVLRQI